VLRGPEAVSPTALYTGHVWVRGGLSHPALATTEGRFLFDALEPANRVSELLGGPTLEGYLLARHRAIDARLAAAIDAGRVGQVLEVAAGLSPRGWRFAERYGDRLTYVEADLPDMARRKRGALERIGSLGPGHRVAELDVLRESGPQSLSALMGELDAGEGLAIVTEGLLGYLDSATVTGLWRRFASALAGFPHGIYVSDLHLGAAQGPAVRVFRVALSAFVRGRVHLHFADAQDARDALLRAGFAHAEVHRAVALAHAADPEWRGRDAGSGLAHIIEASTK
jgi:O-methyltransferase involved in polyketide biosynthesis